MIRKNIVSGTGVDKQSQQITLPALREYAEFINSSDTALRMGLNHDRTLPPVGKVISGELIPYDGKVLLEATIDDFIEEFERCIGPNGEPLYRGKSTVDSRPFAGEKASSDAQLMLKINPIHFTQEEFSDVTEYLQSQCNIKVDTTFEKGIEPTIQLVFLFAHGLIAILSSKTKERAARKLSDEIANDIAKMYTKLKDAIVYVTKKIASIYKKDFIFVEPGQPVEFVVRAKTANEVLDAFVQLRAFDFVSVVEQFKHYTNDNIDKIQFLFDDVDTTWKMTYLTTKDGQVIGKEATYKKAVKIYQEIMECPTAGFSIAGTATYNDSECRDNA